MRCKNCGWENEQGRLSCEKCSSPLSEPSTASENAAINLKGTIPEGRIEDITPPYQIKGIDNKSIPHNCPKCGYPFGRGVNICPMCGTSADGQQNSPVVTPVFEKPENISIKCSECGVEIAVGSKFCPSCGAPQTFGTVNPWATPQKGSFCTLRLLPWENENADHPVNSYSGTSVILNRENTEPNNPTITSHEQAELTYEDGAWYICDKSAQQTTYVHAGRKTRLEKGDIIILGNRRFEFNG